MAEQHLTDRDLLVRIDERVCSLEHRLFGNGQPGEIADMRSKISKLERDRDIARGSIFTGKWLIGLLGVGNVLQIIYFAYSAYIKLPPVIRP
jgi:hypothetical protein